MFGFLKKKRSISESGFLKEFTDLHTHLLPAIDDGIKSLPETLDALAYLESEGVKRVCFTPHIMEDYPHNNKESLQENLQKFQQAYKGNLKIHLAAEYMLDSAFKKHLSGGLLTIGKNKHVLVETSYINPPLGMERTLYNIFSEGYQIILAHPERYLYMNFEQYHELAEKGIAFQLNILSLLGIYGKGVKERTEYLLNKDLYKHVGTDIHKLSFHKGRFEMKHLTGNQIDKLLKLKENNNRLF